MKKVLLGLTAVLSVAAAFPPVHAQAPRTLRLFIWSDYMDPAVLRDFEKKYGAKVVVDTYESNEAMLAKLQGGGARYDVAVPSNYVIGAMAQAKLLQPLRKSNLPNLKNIDQAFLNAAYDKGNTYSVPYQYSATGLLYRSDKLKSPAQSWSLIFGPEDKVRFVLLDDPREVIGAALLYLGFSSNSTDRAQLAKARDLLVKTKAKKGFVGFDGGPGVRNKLIAGDADVGQQYAGDAGQGMAESKKLGFFLPKEGAVTSMDTLVVLKGARDRDLAEKFIDFVLDAKVSARISNFTKYANPNAAARPFVDAALRSNPGLYPPASVQKKLEYTADVGDAARLYDRVWTDLKAR